jgi:hypothetical protein
VLLASAGLAEAQTLSNFASFGNVQDPFSNSPPQTTTGLVFTAPAGPIAITDFSFKLVRGFGTFGVSAHLYRWDGEKATGPSLFDSGGFDIAGTSFSFETFKFNTGAVELSGGATYIAFLTRSKYSQSWGGLFPGVLTASSPWAGSQYNFFGNAGDFDALLTTPWSQRSAPWKLAFEANFIPTPGVAGLLGMAGLIAVRRRR